LPYIKKECREKLDFYLNPLGDLTHNEGELNYAITRLALKYVLRRDVNYANLSTVIGTLRLVAAELEHRVVNDYEFIKRNANGDVPEYIEIFGQLNKERLCSTK
jgi:hypothetical protein